MIVKLTRVGQSPSGTTGVLSYGNVAFAVTLEQPWRANQQDISCIPPGLYPCQSIRSPRFGPTYEVMHVPGRTHIVFHKGNDVEDTHGCILIAEEFSGTFDKPMIVSSQRGFGEFMALVSGQPTFELDVVDAALLSNVHASVPVS